MFAGTVAAAALLVCFLSFTITLMLSFYSVFSLIVIVTSTLIATVIVWMPLYA